MGGMIVLKDLSLHACMMVGCDFKCRSDFKKEVTKRNQSAKTHAQGQIFDFSSRQSDF